MAMTAPDKLRQRARLAYEWGRLWRAATKAWPAPVLTAISCWLCHEPGLSLSIGVGLLALATGLGWYGRTPAQAASAGMRAGIGAFAVPVAAFHSYFAPECCTLAAMLIVNGGCGVGVGVLLSLESTRLQSRRNVFLLWASAVAALCGMLGCILFGPVGLAGMAAGVLLSTAPVAIYRRAIA
ncbi:MAG TPA: hypothetical protein VNZ53_21095 [Steroidobacteraceae bacterium]|jgi:hypothetical protein|nr:hypothetical protein [Steroidobacteraceae bacterium]